MTVRILAVERQRHGHDRVIVVRSCRAPVAHDASVPRGVVTGPPRSTLAGLPVDTAPETTSPCFDTSKKTSMVRRCRG